MGDILLSINCITYNHEKYIADAIESFLMQKTNFKYEILIHDDASTDKTAEIIRKYERQYPGLIKPIFQSENQYSKGNGKRIIILNQERALGQYIAFCEGDDYWTDPYKLQKQVEILEGDHSLAASFHKVEEVTTNKKKKGTYIEVPYLKSNNKYDIYDIIRFDGRKIHLSSLVFRKEFFNTSNIPDFFYDSVVGDLPMMLILATRGEFYYFSDSMSCTRRDVPNGASQRLFKGTESFINSNNKIMECYNRFNEFTEFVYSDYIKEVLTYREFLNYEKKGNYSLVKNSEYFKNSNTLNKLKIWLRCNFPIVYTELGYIKERLRLLRMNK